MTQLTFNQLLVEQFNAGEVFAYPTEAVLGLGCDPDNQEAVTKLLALKNRPVEKGLILIARSYSQLLPYVNDAKIPMDKRTEIFSSWPGPITWLLPAAKSAPNWITGGSEFIAVRVSQHPVVCELCELLEKPIVSTSANVSGENPAKNSEQLYQQFNKSLLLVHGELGGETNPSLIRHGITGQIIRGNT
ncbi:Sua5/YciO/YrdC/YwlC family protein [Paraglaciecola aestuariivivens]